MAVRTTDAAASLSPDRTVFSCFLSCKSQCFCTYSSCLPVFKRAYSREFLLDVGRTIFLELNSAHAEELRDLGLLRRPTPSPTPTTASRPQRRRYKRRERKQKRGKRGGIRARLAANPHKPAIPTILLANVRSLDNKLDYIRLLRSTQRTVRDCCVFVFTETWLNNSVPDCAIQLEQLTCYRADRALVEGGKRRGGGLCVYINNVWCRDAVVVCKHCSPLVEFKIIKCRPFYLPREYTAILLVAVYIPPSSNNINRSEALHDLYQHISEQQKAHSDAFLILAGDFNHADLKSVFPKIHQHVDFPTRGKNTLDFVYTTRRGAYKDLPLPHLGASDHITVMLMPAYRPLVKVIKPIHKQIQVWPEGSSEALQDCFDTTDWNMFKQAATYNSTTDLQEYSETVTAYITKCIDDVTVTKTINARKAPAPDNIPGRVLRDCAVELTDVFTDIFNISLSQAVVPTCFKATTIIPVPKKSSPSCFNDYRPVALTPILMKCFERLVMQHIKSVLPPSLDPFQFAYRSNRSTDDAIATALHSALTHLDKRTRMSDCCS